MAEAASRLDATPELAAVGFAAAARRAGLEVPVTATLAFTRALEALGLRSPHSVYWAGRATFVTDPSQVEAYDRAFVAFWGEYAVDESVPSEATTVIHTDGRSADDAQEQNRDDAGSPPIGLGYSRIEVLRHRDFASYTGDEHREARRLMEDLRFATAWRRSRRRELKRCRRGRFDFRSTVRRTLQTGGEAATLEFRRRATQPRRLVLLLDVSGSMEPYARALARFVHSAVVSRRRVEAFAIGTRLTRMTRELSSRDPDRAMADAARRVLDWSGGTRLGEALQLFNDGFGVRGIARGSVIVILSDGWDRGDPQLLAREMARLARVAHRIVWVNPLKAGEGYEPLARGMAAALPYVDDFVEGHSLSALERLAEVISR